MSGNLSWWPNSCAAVLPILSPIAVELKRMALFERPRGRQGHSPGYARYSVAVWPANHQATNEKAEYWVGVELFWTAGYEFFLNHFSDAMEWKNEWRAMP